MEPALGIDIGGTKTAAAIVGPDGSLLGEPVVLPTPATEGAEAIIATVIRCARQVLAQSTVTVTAAGVGSAGVIDRHGVVTSATDLLHGWTGTPLAARISDGLGLPVTVLNDVHAAALGEAALGAARGRHRVLVVAVGTGIGGALIRDGELDLGPGGIAGSVGHLPISRSLGRSCSCGVPDHVEAHASGPAIERTYRELGGEATGLRRIAERQAAGETLAGRAIREGARALGEGIAAAANLLDPDCIVVGGGVAELGAVLLDTVRRTYRERVLPPAREVPVVSASLGPGAALVGAALAARPGHRN